MTTYRQELEAAHTRITALENELAERDSESESESESAPPTTARIPAFTFPQPLPSVPTAPEPLPPNPSTADRSPIKLWQSWPLASLLVTLIVFVRQQAEGSDADQIVTVCSGFGIAASVVMVLRFIVQIGADNKSSRLDRLLFALGTLIGLPVIVPVGLAAIQVGSVVLGIVGIVATVIGGVVWLVNWISKGSESESKSTEL